MKKTVAMLLAVLLMLSLLTSCGAAKEQTKPETLPECETEISDIPKKKEEIIPPEQMVEAETLQEAEQFPALLEDREPMDAAGVLWYIPNEILETEQYQDLYMVGDNMLLTRMAYNGDPYGGNAVCTLYLAMLSIETGEVLRETELEGFVSAHVQACGDRIAVSDWETKRMILLDPELNIVSEYGLGPDWHGAFLSSDAETMYGLTEEEGIWARSLKSGETTQQLEQLRDIYASGQKGDMVSFSCVDLSTQFTAYGVLDLSDGSAAFLPYDGAFYGVSFCNDVWLAGVLGQDNVVMVGAEEEPSYLMIETGYARLSAAEDETRLLVNRVDSSGNMSMTFYETDGSFLSSAAQPIFRQAYCTEPVWSPICGGYFFTVTTYDGKTQLFFWDLSIPMQGADLSRVSLEDTRPTAGQAVAAELYDRAEELSELYGVTIRIAEQCGTEYFSYFAEQSMDESEISTALDMLDETLADYPDGFIEQLKYGTYREIEINLTGELTPRDLSEDANGFTSFIAFVEQNENRTVMVLDIGEGVAIKQHIYHEMSHIIDRKLEFDAQYRKEALFSEEAWAALNPDGFDYVWDYHQVPDSIYRDGYDSWFIDTYARTFPSEDRARILEYAMFGHHYPFEEGSPLREKLEFYAACIRDCFDTAGWPERTMWEEAL